MSNFSAGSVVPELNFSQPNFVQFQITFKNYILLNNFYSSFLIATLNFSEKQIILINLNTIWVCKVPK